MPRSILFGLAAVTAASFSFGAHAAAVEVKVANAAPKGEIYVSLCTEVEFLQACKLSRKVAIGQTARFEAAPGRYAMMAFQDVDGDGKMERGDFGQPLEPWAISRDAKAEGGPPSFEDAVVVVVAGENSFTVNLNR